MHYAFYLHVAKLLDDRRERLKEPREAIAEPKLGDTCDECKVWQGHFGRLFRNRFIRNSEEPILRKKKVWTSPYFYSVTF